MSRILRWLGHPRAPRFVVAFALVLALPSLAVGFFSDDYAFVDWLERRIPLSPPWWDLYRFTPGDPATMRECLAKGLLPWWTTPALHLHLVRPLSSALLALDHAVFGRAAIGWHLHSLAWYAVLLAAASQFFRRLLPPATATMALLLFVLSDANVFPFAWPSSRHILLAATFAVLGVTAHVRFRAESWRPGRFLGPLALAAGLLASEAALGGFTFAIAYDLVGPQRGALRDRVARALPLGTLAVAYLVAYTLVGGGARGSAGYVSPTDPVAFLSIAAVRVPVLLGTAILGVPADFANVGFARGMAIAGAVATVLFALLWRACARVVPEGERATLTWLALGAFTALAASVGGFPGARELLVANLGFAPLMATVLCSAFASGPFAVARRAGAGLLAVVHVALAPLSQLVNQYSMQTIARATEATANVMQQEIHGRPRVRRGGVRSDGEPVRGRRRDEPDERAARLSFAPLRGACGRDRHADRRRLVRPRAARDHAHARTLREPLPRALAPAARRRRGRHLRRARTRRRHRGRAPVASRGRERRGARLAGRGVARLERRGLEGAHVPCRRREYDDRLDARTQRNLLRVVTGVLTS